MLLTPELQSGSHYFTIGLTKTLKFAIIISVKSKTKMSETQSFLPPSPETRAPDYMQQQLGNPKTEILGIRELQAEPMTAVMQGLGEVSVSRSVENDSLTNHGLVDGDFIVKRSDGAIEKKWSVRGSEWTDNDGNKRLTIETPDSDNNESQVLTEDVLLEDLLSWQSAENELSLKLAEATKKYNKSGFKVKRTDGSIDKDWTASGFWPDSQSGKVNVILSKIDSVTGQVIEKRVSTDTLDEWNTETGQTEVVPSQVKKPDGYYVRDYQLEKHAQTASAMLEKEYPKESLELMLKGTFHGKVVDELHGIVRGAGAQLGVRETLAELVAQHPETAQVVLDMDIVGIHGTGSAALADILTEGALLSASEAKKRGIKHATGEHVWQHAEGQNSISFTTLEDVGKAMTYSGEGAQPERTNEQILADLQNRMDILRRQIENDQDQLREGYVEVIRTMIADTQHTMNEIRSHPDGVKAELLREDFPVFFGVSKEGTWKGEDDRGSGWVPVQGTSGDYNEFRAAREVIPLEEMLVAVPENKIGRVKELFNLYDKPYAKIVPIEHFFDTRESLRRKKQVK